VTVAVASFLSSARFRFSSLRRDACACQAKRGHGHLRAGGRWGCRTLRHPPRPARWHDRRDQAGQRL